MKFGLYNTKYRVILLKKLYTLPYYSMQINRLQLNIEIGALLGATDCLTTSLIFKQIFMRKKF